MNKRQDFWLEVKGIFKKISEKFDSTWRKRKRILDSQFMVAFIFKLIESKNNQGYGSNLVEFWESCENQGIALAQDKTVSASSFCEARQKLPEEIFIELNQELLSLWNKTQKLPKFKGYRLFAIDGSRVTVPRELIDEGFKLYDKKRGRHYPQGLMSCLYNLQEKIIYDFDFVTHMNERTCALEHMKHLTRKDIMIFDRGYFSYLLFRKVIEGEVQAIFRMQVQAAGINKEISKFLQSGKGDAIITYIPSTTVIHDLKKQGHNLDCKPLTMRLIKHKLSDEIYLYATTLLDNKTFPTSCFPKIYHGRWSIEELYKISKKFLEIEEFHSKTARGVRQELYAHILLINLSRFLESEAQDLVPPAKRKGKNAKKAAGFINVFNPLSIMKVNFKNCLLVVGRNLVSLILKGFPLVHKWLERIRKSIARVRQKIRTGRHYPRISHKPRAKWMTSGRNRLEAT